MVDQLWWARSYRPVILGLQCKGSRLVDTASGRYPVLTGWFAGPKADTVTRLTVSELVNMGLDSLTEIFNLPLHSITRDLITSQAINWGIDAFARGAYSYATPKTREAQTALRKSDAGAVFFSGEALYAGRDIGTVEAALVSGTETAQAILGAG